MLRGNMKYKDGDIIYGADIALDKDITKVSLSNNANCIPIENGTAVIVDISVLTDIINSAVMDMFDLYISKKDDLFEVKFLDKKI